VAELTKLASAKRLCTGDYTEVSRCLKKLVGDVNLAVAVEAVQAIGNLASGLRKDFTAGARLLLPVLLVSFHPRSLNWTTLLIVFC
jgi:cytoskeleton-associated protein 5